MSAGERRHEDAPKKIDERVISEDRLSWIQTPESERSIALAQQRVRDLDRRSEITSGAAVEKDETRDRLLCAIGDTEIARLMGDRMPADDRQPHAPACIEPPKTPFTAVGAKVQPPAEVMHPAPAAGPGRSFIVQASPVAASRPLQPPSAVPPRHPAPPQPDSILETDKTRDRLLRAIGEAGRLGGGVPASNPRLRLVVQNSPQAASAPLMPPATAPPRRRVSATSGMIEAAATAAVPQVPSPPQTVAVAESEPAVTTSRSPTPALDRSPRTAILVNTILAWCGGEINRLGAKLAGATKSMGRALWQLSVRFESRVVPKAALTVKSMGLASWQLSAQFKNRVVAIAALTMESTGSAGSRLVRFRSERPQLSTGLDGRAHAAQSAPAMESTGQAAQQPPTRIKRWLDPRRSLRIANPPVVAYCWTADTPHPVKIADIGSGGVRLLTDARWPQGGMLSMTLQRTDRTSETPDSWIVIDFMVLRLCNDGVAGAFISSTHRLSGFIPSRAENCADEKTLKRFVRNLAVPNRA